MTPHIVLESMDSYSAEIRAILFPISEEEADVRSALLDAVHFNFGASVPLREHIEFGLELHKRGIFQLPASTVFYTSNALPNDAIVTRVVAGDCYGLFEQPVLFIIRITRMFIQHECVYVPLLIGSSEDVDFENFDSCMDTWKGETLGADDMNYRQGLNECARFILGAASLLMSKDVEIKCIPAPRKLNEQRVKKGRYPIRESMVIKIKREKRVLYADVVKEYKRTHASPRMHFRRGHFRRLGADRIIPIAPTIVNVSEETLVQIKRYEIE